MSHQASGSVTPLSALHAEPHPFYWSKWLTFSAAAVIQLSAGLGYTFSVYSDALKKQFDLSQPQLAGLGTACNVGGYLSLFAGLAYDSLKQYRLGPPLTMLVGCAFQVCGYLAIWAAATGQIHLQYWQICMLLLIAGNGQTWWETTALVTTVRNFETERGTVIGILKALLGLSASCYITLYVAFLEPDAVSFLKVLAIVPSCLAFVCAFFINYVPFIQVEPHTKSHAFHVAFTSVIALAFYQTITAIARNAEEGLDYWSGVLITGAVCVLLMPILAIPFIFGGLRAKSLDLWTTHAPKGEAALAESSLLQPLLQSPERSDSPGSLDDQPADLTSWESLQTLNFWLLWVAGAIGSGAGLTLLNNLAQQVIALGGNQSSQSILVSLFSISNCGGRLLAGFLPDKLMREAAYPRTVSLVGLSAITLGSSLLNAYAPAPWLMAASSLSGFAFGGFQGLVPAITSELFGLGNFASIYALVQLGPAVGVFYQRELHKDYQKGSACIGANCFRPTFLVIAACCGVGCLLSLLLWLRSKEHYGHIITAMLAERERRGLRAEVTESQYIMEACIQENQVLAQLLKRGKRIVQEMEQRLPRKEGSESPRILSKKDELPILQAVEELTGLVDEANYLLVKNMELQRKYRALPTLQRRNFPSL